VAAKLRWERPVATHVGPTKEESARKFHEFTARMIKNGVDNPYPHLDRSESVLESPLEVARKALDHARAKNLKARVNERNKRLKGGRNRGAGNVERDRRVHDRAVAGETVKKIAADERLEVNRVYGILRKPRPP